MEFLFGLNKAAKTTELAGAIHCTENETQHIVNVIAKEGFVQADRVASMKFNGDYWSLTESGLAKMAER